MMKLCLSDYSDYFNYCYIYELNRDYIFYDHRANDGSYCSLPYKNHKHGCPQFPSCVNDRKDWMDIPNYKYNWYAFVREFSIKQHASIMKDKNGKLTDNQCRCVLYYQPSIDKIIRGSILDYFGQPDFKYMMLLDRPEASGINVYKTMSKHGLYLKADYSDIIYKMMFVGINKVWKFKSRRLDEYAY